LFHKLPVNQEEYEKYLSRLEVTLDAYDGILSKRRYVAGDVHLIPIFYVDRI